MNELFNYKNDIESQVSGKSSKSDKPKDQKKFDKLN